MCIRDRAGSDTVLELHGTAREIQCQDCGFRTPRSETDNYIAKFLETNQVPACPQCDSDRMKHATISFGQMLPREVLRQAEELSLQCDLFIAIGSSLVVTPAADLPRLAKSHGARLVIINRDATPLDSISDLVVRDSIGAFLESTVYHLSKALS